MSVMIPQFPATLPLCAMQRRYQEWLAVCDWNVRPSFFYFVSAATGFDGSAVSIFSNSPELKHWMPSEEK